MVMIANLQYGWTLFIDPIEQKYHWGRAAIQVAFTIFIVTETWLQPLGGYLIDRFGPRVMVCIGGALVATAWAINSVADSLALFYLAAIITMQMMPRTSWPHRVHAGATAGSLADVVVISAPDRVWR